MSDMLDWAKREVEIVSKKENPNRKEGEFYPGCSCCESALKAFKSLCDDGHSGMSIKMTQEILNRLINGQPLTPIEDTDDIWDKCSRPKDGPEVYQCSRMFSLFKNIYPDGSVKYSDNNRVFCVDINDPNNTYSSGLVRRIIDKMFPITMPYMPGKPFRVYCEDFPTDRNSDGIYTVGIYYAFKEENGEQKRIEINRFFREGEPDESGKWIEISVEEYEKRRAVSES